ncbi:MFS transporter [Streptomyces sp. NBC_00286]|uniref:MFS transporter n=1 Tax=Streptomyces sp. NBC_00286 TaxID=2975701 RepID=UPI002E27B23B|nr:MFS transporter [Streptomyces sp. NBC_00286]
MKSTKAGRQREERTLYASTLTNGPNELFDFLLPLWAGATLGLSATEIGILLAVEMALSVIARPIAGVLADSFERRYVAATGAFLYAASAVGYALAHSAPTAYAAAAVGGVGGALLWVGVRAIASERLAEDSAVFPRLLAAQETGSWVAFVAGMALIGQIDFDGIFWACAAACVLAGSLLLSSPRRQTPRRSDTEGTAAAGLGAIGRKLRPMLGAVALTMAAEAAISLLLLLHLQREFDLSVLQVAYVFLPGAIAMSIAAEHLHTYVVRLGRTRILMLASLASTAFAAGLAWAPNPYVIAALWILSGLAWAAVIPIQQSVIAEASGDHAGRGMGVYESAKLLGALAGSLAAGVLYDAVDWTVACLGAAALILVGAVVVPRAVRRLGVADVPPPPPDPQPPAEEEDDLPPVETGGKAEAEKDMMPVAAAADAAAPPADAHTATAARTKNSKDSKNDADVSPPKSQQQLVRELGQHAVAYVAAQVILLLLGLSWLHSLITGDSLDVLISGTGRDEGLSGLLEGVGKIWTFVLLVHAMWTGTKCLAMSIGQPSEDPPTDEHRERG